MRVSDKTPILQTAQPKPPAPCSWPPARAQENHAGRTTRSCLQRSGSKAGQQRRIDEHRATAGKLHAAAARTQNLDAVVHLVQQETPVRPLGGQPLERQPGPIFRCQQNNKTIASIQCKN